MEDFILQVIVALLAAKIIGEVFRKAYIHPLVADIIIGIILGPSLLGFLDPTSGIKYLAYFGLIILMFYAGLTSNLKVLTEYKGMIIATGVSGVIVTFLLVLSTCLLQGIGIWTALFIAIVLSNTATEVTAIITEAEEKFPSRVKTILVGASFVDDVLAVYFITTLRLIVTGSREYQLLIFKTIEIMLFIFLVLYISRLLVTKATRTIYKLFSTPARAVSSTIVIVFTLSLIARIIGLNEVIGAYLGGLAVSRLREIRDPTLINILRIEELAHNLRVMLEGFLTAFFFIYVGLLYNIHIGTEQLLFTLTLLIPALAGKIIGCSIPILLSNKNIREALIVGIGMTGRGALESAILVFALEAGIINNIIYSVILTTTLASTIIAPITLRIAVKSLKPFTRIKSRTG